MLLQIYLIVQERFCGMRGGSLENFEWAYAFHLALNLFFQIGVEFV
jgi:hypothetical protein